LGWWPRVEGPWLWPHQVSLKVFPFQCCLVQGGVILKSEEELALGCWPRVREPTTWGHVTERVKKCNLVLFEGFFR